MELELDLDVNQDATAKPVAEAAEQKVVASEPVSFDRRHSVRPQGPRPGRLLAFQLHTDKLVKVLCATRARCIIFIGLQFICMMLIIWSMTYRYTGLSNIEILESDAITLRSELDTLKSQWSGSELEQIETSLSQAESRVFEDYTSFAAWLKDKTEFASRLGMAMSYRIGQQKQTSLADTVSLPVYMSLKVQERAADNAYVRALEYVRSLIDENLRLEVFGNEVKSGKDGIASIDLDIHVWVHSGTDIHSDTGSEDTANAEVADVAFIQ